MKKRNGNRLKNYEVQEGVSEAEALEFEVTFPQVARIGEEPRFGEPSPGRVMTRADHENLAPVVAFSEHHVTLFFGSALQCLVAGNLSRTDQQHVLNELARKFAVEYSNVIVDVIQSREQFEADRRRRLNRVK